ncbi:MAG: hypothetical protein EKK41_16945 [Hyphomicrobiales bacterium]|nr:MAG: hypothetical protein EKK41_16945 [Hyphomicrobiales bacterium]
MQPDTLIDMKTVCAVTGQPSSSLYARHIRGNLAPLVKARHPSHGKMVLWMRADDFARLYGFLPSADQIAAAQKFSKRPIATRQRYTRSEAHELARAALCQYRTHIADWLKSLGLEGPAGEVPNIECVSNLQE